VEDRQLFFDQGVVVVKPISPVPPDVVLQAAHDVPGSTVEHDKRPNSGDLRDVPGLALVTRDSVQHEQVICPEALSLKEAQDDLLGEGKVLVLEQEPSFEHPLDHIKLSLRLSNTLSFADGEGPQLGTKVEMMGSAVEQTVARYGVAERGLARARWAEQQQSRYRQEEPVRKLHGATIPETIERDKSP
jgi:hypothetical protein